MGDGAGTEDEDKERTKRQLGELLQELRVATTGVQVLFAFLLTVGFQARFAHSDSFKEHVLLVTLLLAAASSGFFIAPTALHRILFHQGDRAGIIEMASAAALAGLVCLAGAITGSVLLAVDEIFDRTTAIVVASATALFFALLWFALPLARRAGRRDPA